MHRLIREIPKPVIAAVNGYAIGGGHVLHVLCDLTIAADTAVFGQTGPRVGSFDAGFGTAYLARVVGEKRAREIWFLCRQYDAETAERWGLVNRVVPAAELRAEVRRWADEMLQLSPTALRFLKQSFNADTEHLAGCGPARLHRTRSLRRDRRGGGGRARLHREARAGLRALSRAGVVVNQAPSTFDELRRRLAEIHYLGRAKALLDWDERTMMPPGGAEARTDQIGALVRVRHEKLAAEELGRLLDELEPFGEELSYDSDDAALIRVAKRDHEKACRVPIELHAEIARSASVAEQVWREAKKRNDFELFLPHLERNVYLKLRYAHCFEREDAYDPLLDDYEPGMKTPEIAAILDDLKEALLPLVAEVSERAAGVDDSFLRSDFPADPQRAVVRRLLGLLPMPGESWRLDETTHPFQTSLSPTDVRLTTRYDEHDLESAIFSSLHEYGHGLYENGVDPALDGTPLGRPTSLGLHESQSRMWENLVGRSLPFWQRFYGMFGQAFPDELNGVGPEGFFRAVNKVEPSLIRIEADELTYDLHILLRFELERELIDGTVEPRDLQAAWNERVRTYLGIDVPDDAHGVLQDVHWAAGEFGYFPTYSLGNVIAAQLWEAAREALPDLDRQIEVGEFEPLREWLREHVHRHGRKYSAAEVVERATGRPIEVGPYVTYLTEKFQALYG